MASLTFMSYADILLAMVPAAPPTRKNQRTTSCPAPISAKVPYQRGSRLILSAFEWVSMVSSFTSQQISPVFRALNVQAVHQSPQGKAREDRCRSNRIRNAGKKEKLRPTGFRCCSHDARSL